MLKKEPQPILEADNIVRFPSGERIEFYGSRIVITRADGQAKLQLLKRMTEEFYDENGTPWFDDVYWESKPSWSDGNTLTHEDVRSLAKLVKIAATYRGKNIRQIFEDETLGIGKRNEFNTVYSC